MFGYVTINAGALSENEKARFREVYCGVCTSLLEGCGHTGRLTLSFDCTFLALLLNALYEPEEKRGEARCAAHPAKKHKFATSEMTEYAADMNMLLFYFSALDGWNDDRNTMKYTLSKMYQKRAKAVSEKYPEKTRVIREELEKLSEIEKARLDDIDAAAGCFGRLLGEVFQYKNDEWAYLLREMGIALGRFIYLLDAWDDRMKDEKKRSYNPLSAIASEPDYEEQVYKILTMEIAECAMAFEKLPIVQDVNLLRNILYSGVWTKYSQKREQMERKGKTV